MKHRTPPREFGFAGEPFQLTGEVLRAPEAQPVPREDRTPDMFTDRAMLEAGRREIEREYGEGNL